MKLVNPPSPSPSPLALLRRLHFRRDDSFSPGAIPFRCLHCTLFSSSKSKLCILFPPASLFAFSYRIDLSSLSSPSHILLLLLFPCRSNSPLPRLDSVALRLVAFTLRFPHS
ncbi:hypothetical protein FRC16_011353 [Serendipita sp. 398]|nr:hypothetical protein FRC16_011353 [Serendipita sp. 398]